MSYSHIGWIPCINGHLDFGLMSPGIVGSFTNDLLKDPKTTSINYGAIHQDNHHARRIILQSKVDWKDTDALDADGDFRVFVVAESNETNDLDRRTLNGSIYIYPLRLEPKLMEGKIELPWFDPLHSADKKLVDFRNPKTETNSDWNEVKSSLNDDYSAVKSALNNDINNPITEHFHKVNFEVSKNGLIKLSFESANKNEIDDETQYLVTRQAFYYIKYSLHFHKHHFTQEDSLTTIIPIEPRDNDKHLMGLRLLGQLKRELTSIKRTYSSGGNRTYCDEQGIIAYMTSFCVSLKDSDYFSDDMYDREMEYLKSIKNSFTVQTNKKEKKSCSTVEIETTYRTYVAWGLSIISIVWLTIARNFIIYEPEQQITNAYNIGYHLLVFLALCCSAAFIYQKQVTYKINNTLNSKGLITWIEQNYMILDAEFKKQNRIKTVKSLASILLIAICTFFLTSLV